MALRTPTPTARPTASTVAEDTGAPRLSALGLVVVLIGVFLPMTDFFIVNVALPTINRDLHASAGMLQLVVAGYAIAYALLLVVGGRLGDLVGRRRLFVVGMATFTLTSLACGLAPSIGTLVAARVLQGAAAAIMLPQVLSTIQATTTGAERARALGRFGATGGIATVIGQVVGGLLVSANIAGTGWRPIFLVNVPVGLLGLVLARRLVPETRSADPAPVDHLGTVLLGAGLLSLLVPLTEGRTLGWPAWSIALLALAPVALFLFLRTERRLEDRGGVPLVPFSIVRVPSMRRGVLMALPFYTGFGGFMFVYTLNIQDGAGLSPVRTGLLLAPMAVGFLLASLSTARLLRRFGRRVITAGALVQATGLVASIASLAAAWPHPSYLNVGPAFFVVGIGQGLIMSPLMGVVLSEVPRHAAGVGSGVLATTQQSSLALGVATVGTLYLTLSPLTRLGALDSALLVLGILAATALVVSALSRRLPNPVQAAEPLPEPEPVRTLEQCPTQRIVMARRERPEPEALEPLSA